MTGAAKPEPGCHSCRHAGLTLLPLRPPVLHKASDEKQQRQIPEAVARYLNQFSNGKQA